MFIKKLVKLLAYKTVREDNKKKTRYGFIVELALALKYRALNYCDRQFHFYHQSIHELYLHKKKITGIRDVRSNRQL